MTTLEEEREAVAVTLAATFPDGLLETSVEVGAVSDRALRVWVRLPDTPSIRGTLQLEGGMALAASAELSTETDWTGALAFELPESAPRARYRLEVAGEVREGRLAPSPGTGTGLTFGFGSCNQPFIEDEGQIRYHDAAGIYDALYADFDRANVSFLMLVGDQLYSDEIEPASVRMELEDGEDALPSLDAEIGLYRQITRGYFGVPGLRRLRQRFPTYCIWDDHDIFNNWGSRQTVSALDQRLFDAATRVYREYQHARNPQSGTGEPPFHYTFEHGDIGFLVLDVRGVRDWNTGHLLGEEEWSDIVGYLHGQAAASVSTLFVVTSIPVGHVAHWFAMLFEHLPGKAADSVRDRWCAAAFQEQRDALLGELFTWQTGEPGRQVVFLSGDIHVAAGFTIRERGGPGVIRQFTSSAMTTPHTWFERTMNHVASLAPNLFEPRWRFERQFLRYENNAGLVRLTPLESGGHHVELLIRGWQPSRQRLRTAARLATRPGQSS